MIVSSDSNSLRLVNPVLGDNLSLLLVCLDLAFKDVPYFKFTYLNVHLFYTSVLVLLLLKK